MGNLRSRRNLGFSLVELLIGLGILGILLSLAMPMFADWMRNTRLRNQADAVLSGVQLARAEALRRNAYVRFQLVSANTALTMDNTCTVLDTSTAGANLWVVSEGDPTTRCGNELLVVDNTAPTGPKQVALYGPYAAAVNGPNLLVKGVRDGRQDEMQTQLTLYRMQNGAPPTWPIFTPNEGPAICFSPTGQLTRYDNTTGRCVTSKNPGTTWTVRASINFDPPAGAGLPTCAPAGTTRCLRVTVGAGGESRLCDRSIPSAYPPLASVAAEAAAALDTRRCPW